MSTKITLSAVGALALAACATPTEPTKLDALLFRPPSPLGQARIAFASDRDGEPEVYIMYADGSGQTRLTFTTAPQSSRQPALSPNAARIAFVSDRDAGHDEIYVMNADGSGQVRLTTTIAGYQNQDPAWSHDGSKIAFTRCYASNCTVYIMNADGSGVVQLTSLDSSEPSWSPDGSKIAFVSRNTAAGYDFIVVMDLATRQGHLTKLYNDPWPWPTWSPDGSKIAFDNWGPYTSGIYVMNADGTGIVRLTNGSDSQAAWSPDGSKIVFMSSRAGTSPTNYQIYAMNADGSGIVPLTTEAPSHVDSHPSWARPPALTFMP